MPESDRQFVSRRTLVISLALAAVIILGVLLFLRFAGNVEPLLGSAWITTPIHA
jgi:hypothetical protein